MSISKKRAVIITGPGFEDAEVIHPFFRLKEEGVEVDICTSSDGEVHGKYGYPIKPTVLIKNLSSSKYDLVVIPGGYEAPDRVRQVGKILDFVKKMNKGGKIISSSCHGPFVLISAGVVRGREATCYPGIKDDLINAGAKYKDAPVVVDGNLITSDHPRSIAAWMKATVESINR